MATKSDSGRTIYPKIGVWFAEDEDGHIRLSIEGQGLTSVTDDPNSVRYHRTLFDKLAKALRASGAKAPPAKGSTSA